MCMCILPRTCHWDILLPVLCHWYPCHSASGDASRPVGVDLPVNHADAVADPSDDSALKYYYFKFVLLTRQDTKAPRNAEQ